ncbi:TPA: NADP-dependent phosphogluconate dehydrogenase [Candidatus Saccharibacteria bacterium]|nr:NADP-dependent phosphogluconate dehydrogenase [Candidatus Saccharibacteria bacterium]HIO87268.1 NADP-dependent phosphogluconate dehydrogenase [Candidatus Saccharibacteria bacterium]
MQIGFIGLGKMGGGMSRRLARSGIEVHGFAPSEESRQSVATSGVITHGSRTDLLGALGEKPVVWVMIPAHLVSTEINELLELLPESSIVIDGGNTPFEQSVDHGIQAVNNSIRFLDIGVSGGQVGEQQGYAMMAGGDRSAFDAVEPFIRELCQPDGYNYFGEAGAGHFVKMVHNAIEYGVMEAFAEGFELIHDGPFKNVDLSNVAKVWQNGSIIQSFINNLAIQIFADNPELEGIDGKVNMLGEAQWAVEFANAVGKDLGVVDYAIKKRAASQTGDVSFGTKYLAATRNAFGGHSLNKISAESKKDSTRNV